MAEDTTAICRRRRTIRLGLLASLRRVLIAVDPSGCAGENDQRSDEIGIVAAGVGHDGIGRILEDTTGRYAPDGWAHTE